MSPYSVDCHRLQGVLGPLVIAVSMLTVTTASAQPAFGPSTPVAELNTANSNEYVTHVSFDGLTLLMYRQQPSAQHDLFISTRVNTSLPWSAPSTSPFSDANSFHFNMSDSVLSQNRLELFYGFGDTSVGNTGFYRATRASTSDPFPTGSLVPGVNVGSNRFHDPQWLSPDSLRLYFRWRHSGVGDLYMVERATTGSAFGTPSAAAFANINSAGNVNSATFTPDELGIIFAIGGDLFWTERPDRFSAFGTAVPLSSVNTGAAEGVPELFGNTLYFTRDGDTYSAEMTPVPEPAFVLLLGTLACGFLVQRRKFLPAP